VSHAEVFGRLYADDGWSGGSGTGSDPDAAAPYCRYIERYLSKHAIGSVLDLGCGDRRIAAAIRWSPAAYRGLDVVMTGEDIRTCPWPAADLVLIKDVFQHWPNADIQGLLPRLAPYVHVLITNSASGVRTNQDIAAGGFRSVDLAAEPFGWPVRPVLRWLGGEFKLTVRLSTSAGLPAVPYRRAGARG
jgi:hypothetical protein